MTRWGSRRRAMTCEACRGSTSGKCPNHAVQFINVPAPKWVTEDPEPTIRVATNPELVDAARRVAEAPEWLRQLIEGGYRLASPTLGDVIVLKVPPNADGVLEMAVGLRDVFDRQVIVLDEGWDLDSPEVPSINICEVHDAPEAITEERGTCWLYDGDEDCRMVRKLLVDP